MPTQPRQRLRVAYQGEPGAFSEGAALRLAGKRAVLLPCRDFPALFASLRPEPGRSAAADAIVVPVENSLMGPIPGIALLRRRHRSQAVGECTLAIAQHFVVRPGARLSDIHTVASHAAALAQCRRFLGAHPQWRIVAAEDTAGSVRSLMAQPDPGRAAIAGARAAALYGAVVRRRHVEDDRANRTRFLLLVR